MELEAETIDVPAHLTSVFKASGALSSSEIRAIMKACEIGKEVLETGTGERDAETHQTLAHRTALYGNFRKEFDKKQHSSRQRRRRQQTHQGFAHEPRFGDNRTAMLIYRYIVVHVAV